MIKILKNKWNLGERRKLTPPDVVWETNSPEEWIEEEEKSSEPPIWKRDLSSDLRAKLLYAQSMRGRGIKTSRKRRMIPEGALKKDSDNSSGSKTSSS
jgi:hypothetical protein